MAGSERVVADREVERALFAQAGTLPSLGEPGRALAPAGVPPPLRTGGALAPAVSPVLPRIRRAVGEMLADEAERGSAFLLVPVAIGLGAFTYFVMPFEPDGPLVAAVLAALALLAVMLRDRAAGGRMALAAFLVVLGVGAGKLEVWRASTPMLGSAVTTRLTGEIEAVERLATGRVRLTLEVIATERPVLRHAPDRVRLTARSVPSEALIGSHIEGVARLFPPSGPVRPASYDFAFESFFDRRGATGFFFGVPQLLPSATDDRAFVERARLVVERARIDVADRIRATIGGPAGEIATALIVGIRGGIPEAANEALRKTGLAHILSISGLHMALVVVTIMGVARFSFALFPSVASRWPVKKLAAALALGVAALYLLVSGAQVAAQRSFVMLAVMLVALLFDQAAITMRNLAIAAILILLVSPHEIVGPSFQMSFAATAALIAAYAAWSEWQVERVSTRGAPAAGWLPAKLARYALGLAATSLIAGLATTIYGVWHFQRVSPLSLLANLAAMPLVGVMVMPFAVLAMALMPFGLDWLPLKVMGKGVEWLLAVADWFAARTPLDAVGQIPGLAVVLLTDGLLVAAVSATRLRWAGLPLALAGLAVVAARDLPDAYLSEDARLVGVRTRDGALAVNRSRPNGFTAENWLRAAHAEELAMPRQDLARDSARFNCTDDGACAIAADGGQIVHAQSRPAAEAYCVQAALVVLADATAELDCGADGAMVVTARDLARRGSAEVRFRDGQATLVFAIREPFRPWHAHRAWSREARGLAPYRREAASNGAED